MDTISKEKRSANMAKIRSRGNRSTEGRLRALLVRSGIAGWKLHPPGIEGKPDFVFPGPKLAVFVDGCFWHGCPKCGRPPKSNQAFWTPKLERNRFRDRRVSSSLRRRGWKVIRIWECGLMESPGKVLDKIRKYLGLKAQPRVAPTASPSR